MWMQETCQNRVKQAQININTGRDTKNFIYYTGNQRSIVIKRKHALTSHIISSISILTVNDIT